MSTKDQGERIAAGIEAIEGRSTSTWAVAGTAATAALASASKAAEPAKSHHLVALDASFDAAQVALLEVKDGGAGGTVIYRRHVHNAASITFDRPLKATAGNELTVELGAGAVGVAGVVSIAGFTE